MSLEAAILENTATLKVLISLMQSGGVLTPGAGTTATATPAPPPGARAKVVDGDPEGTLYFVDKANKVVYAQKPGDPEPGVETMEKATAAAYLKAKAAYAQEQADAKKEPAASPTAAPSTAPAATPAVDTPLASTASGSTSAPEWKTVVEKIREISKGDEAKGLGRAAVLELLGKHGFDGTKGKQVPDLEGLNKHAEILAFCDAKLNPPAAAADDDLGI